MKLFLILVAAMISSVAAATTSINKFTDHVMVEEQKLQLCNRADIRVMAMFNVGEAALYLQECDRTQERLDQPAQLSIVYRRDFSAKDFQSSARKLLKRNLDSQTFNAIEAELKRFNDNYQAMSKGDRYDICYSQKSGLMLHKNGELISSSQSQQLGEAYLMIWFGDRPFSQKLKKKLLAASNG
ncbi:chalcone isomerase family protein [bacterium SCSIO 12696]|nr:chalcone isomerase family protein [bacterium SCSIO 12696]